MQQTPPTAERILSTAHYLTIMTLNMLGYPSPTCARCGVFSFLKPAMAWMIRMSAGLGLQCVGPKAELSWRSRLVSECRVETANLGHLWARGYHRYLSARMMIEKETCWFLCFYCFSCSLLPYRIQLSTHRSRGSVRIHLNPRSILGIQSGSKMRSVEMKCRTIDLYVMLDYCIAKEGEMSVGRMLLWYHPRE